VRLPYAGEKERAFRPHRTLLDVQGHRRGKKKNQTRLGRVGKRLIVEKTMIKTSEKEEEKKESDWFQATGINILITAGRSRGKKKVWPIISCGGNPQGQPPLVALDLGSSRGGNKRKNLH